MIWCCNICLRLRRSSFVILGFPTLDNQFPCNLVGYRGGKICGTSNFIAFCNGIFRVCLVCDGLPTCIYFYFWEFFGATAVDMPYLFLFQFITLYCMLSESISYIENAVKIVYMHGPTVTFQHKCGYVATFKCGNTL